MCPRLEMQQEVVIKPEYQIEHTPEWIVFDDDMPELISDDDLVEVQEILRRTQGETKEEQPEDS